MNRQVSIQYRVSTGHLSEKLVCSQLAGGGEVPATLVDKHQGTDKKCSHKKNKIKKSSEKCMASVKMCNNFISI